MPESTRLLILRSNHEPLWVRLYVQPYADQWAAMLVGDEVPLPEPGTVTRLTFFGATPEAGEADGGGQSKPRVSAVTAAPWRRRGHVLHSRHSVVSR